MQDLVRSSFFQYYLHGGGDLDPTPDTGGGLLDALGSHSARVNCACHTAPVSVTTRVLAVAPGGPEPGWEITAELDIASDGHLVVLHGTLTNPLPRLDNLSSSGAGTYRVRCQARGRQEASQHAVLTEPLEHHLIQAWPVPAGA